MSANVKSSIASSGARTPKAEWRHFFTGRGKTAFKDATFCVNHYGAHRRLLKITTKTEVLQESISDGIQTEKKYCRHGYSFAMFCGKCEKETHAEPAHLKPRQG